MQIQDKIDATTGIFNQAIDVLESSMKGTEDNRMVIKSAITALNGHIKLVNAKKGEEALALAKKRMDLDWSMAISENKTELKKLLSAQSK